MHKNQAERPLLHVKECAEILDVTPHTIRRAIASGELRALRVGSNGHYRIRTEDLDALLRPTTGEAS